MVVDSNRGVHVLTEEEDAEEDAESDAAAQRTMVVDSNRGVRVSTEEEDAEEEAESARAAAQAGPVMDYDQYTLPWLPWGVEVGLVTSSREASGTPSVASGTPSVVLVRRRRKRRRKLSSSGGTSMHDLSAKEEASQEQPAEDEATKEQTAKDEASKEQAAEEKASKEQAAWVRVRFEDEASKEQAAEEKPSREQAAEEKPSREQAAEKKPSKEQAAEEKASKALMRKIHRAANLNVNLPIVATHAVAAALREGSQHEDVVTAASWVLLCFAVIFGDCMFLLALGTTNNWVSCTADIDCQFGTTCAALTERPNAFCLDCNFLAGPPHGVADPWAYDTMGGFVNTSTTCNQFLEGEIDPRLFKGRSPLIFGDGCLFASLASSKMAVLDWIILIMAFLLLALKLSQDAREMSSAHSALSIMCPWEPLEWRRGSLARAASISLLHVIQVFFSQAVPALVPGTLLVMLLVQGSSSSDIILNGLSVSFVLELDNCVPYAFLREGSIEQIKEDVSEAITKHELMRAKDTLQYSPSERLPHQVAVRYIAAFCSFCLGFNRMSEYESGIPCEMLIYFAYYRVTITYNMWVPWLLQEIVVAVIAANDLACKTRPLQMPASKTAHHGAEHDERANTQRLALGPLVSLGRWLGGVVGRFIKTLLCCLTLNALFFFCTAILQWGAPVNFAIRHYFAGFVSDVFGFCAASGYAASFGYSCLAA